MNEALIRQMTEANSRGYIAALIAAVIVLGSVIGVLTKWLLAAKDKQVQMQESHQKSMSELHEKQKGEILGIQARYNERVDEIQNARVEEVQAVTQAALALERATIAAENRRGGK